MRRARSASMPFSIAVAFVAAALAVTLCACTSGGGSSGMDGGSTSAASSAVAAPSGDFGASLDAALANARGCDIAQGEGYEWVALALARAGDGESQSALGSFADAMEKRVRACGGVLDERNATEYSKAILALTSVGVDARDVGGFDIVKPLCDVGFVESQGANGPIWALIALGCHPSYAKGKDAQAAREKLLDQVIASQGADGGWSYTGEPGDEGDADLTAMALTALAPFRAQDVHPEAAEAVERGLEFLSGVQQADGGFAYKGNESSESAAQVVIALSSLGFDPAADARFTKDSGTPLANLLSFQDASGGFAHEAGGALDTLASDQGTCALVAAQRQRAGQTTFYDMSDVDLG